MYTLRKIVNNIETNICLGSSYTLVNRETNYDEFEKIFKEVYESPHYADLDHKSTESMKKCFAFIVHNNGVSKTPLLKGDYNYIMSINGNTFCNLTSK